jgi:hypothetical protein
MIAFPVSIENVSKIIALVVSVFSVYKAFFILVHQRKERFRSDYEFAEKFMAEDKWKTLHDYLLEQGYLGLTGKQLEASIIRFFLLQKDPLPLFSSYMKGRKFLVVNRDEERNILSIVMKDPLTDANRLKRKKIRVLVEYTFFGLISLLPFILLPIFLSNISTFITMIGWVLSFGVLAYINLEELASLQAAKQVVDKFNVSNGIVC